jgi:molybdopterin molybdotransferase
MTTEKQEYLTVDNALSLVLSRVVVLSPESVPLFDSLGRVLATGIQADISLPPFANSSMDGYAVRAEDVSTASSDAPVPLRVKGDIPAGTVSSVVLASGTAARIMTGAPLPSGADSVVPVEDTDEPWRDPERPLPGTIEIRRAVKPGDYIRHPGEDIQQGDEILSAGRVIRPQEIGVLASLGIARVSVIKRPKVGILSTGDELVDVSEPLGPGKIRNSNGYAQTAQVIALGAEPLFMGVARDDEVDVRKRLHLAIEQDVDLLVSSAGVSVGAYDVVKNVLEKDGDVAFWRVRMRPGKPLAFGNYHGIPFIGLPGNPVSAMVSFERFVRPAILKMAGHSRLDRPTLPVTVVENINSDGRENYLRAVVSREGNDYFAKTTGGQGSHIMTSLVHANALLIVPEGVVQVAAGEKLQALMIDWPGIVF